MHKKIILSLFMLAFFFNTTQAQRHRDSDRFNYEREYKAKKKELEDLREKMEKAEKTEKTKLNRQKAEVYGRNFIRFTPIKFLDLNAAGFGLEYEHLLGKSKRFGINIPVTLMFKQNRVPGLFGVDEELHYSPYFYINPGLKIYPSGQKKVTFATGPSLMVGYGADKQWITVNTPTSSYTQYTERENVRLGLIIMNYLNFQFTPEFSMSIDAGIGIRYINHYTNPDHFDDINPTGQFSLGFSYRF